MYDATHMDGNAVQTIALIQAVFKSKQEANLLLDHKATRTTRAATVARRSCWRRKRIVPSIIETLLQHADTAIDAVGDLSWSAFHSA